MDKFTYFSREDIDKYQISPPMNTQDIFTKMYDDFYEVIEATICSVMAAGIPLSDIRLSTPKINNNGNIYTLNCHIMFRGIHFN